MNSFWPPAIAMALLALVFTVPPLLRSRKRSLVDRDQLNTAVVKEQLAELQADLESGKLDQAAYTAARHDLERELLDELDRADTPVDQDTHSGRWAVALFVPLIPLLAIALYQQLGAGDLLDKIESGPVQQAGSGNGAAPPHDIEAVVAKLAQRLSEQPDNLEGWLLLGRAYARMQRFQEAANAYKQARRLAGDQPDLLIDYADMLVSASGGEFSDEVGQLLRTALQKQPDNLKGLWLMGHWKYQRGDNRGAIEDWQQVAQQLPPGNAEDAAAIRQQIQMARARMGVDSGDLAATTTKAPAAAKPAANGGAGIKVSVTLDAGLADKAAPDDTVFIYARAVSGPRMPLAIARKKVRDLPISVTLDDSMAMSPAMVLSRFPQVTLGARISKTGQAIAQSGDLQGIRSPVTPGQKETVQIVIDEVVE
ncbi:MAG TPA: c-type cytochrome biogenesis protein CcmI [Gammaproteobacteria bacterium]|nr:c-type cytochrome biogenesis protein CcmI [Gammaproteobacteria bacterium]